MTENDRRNTYCNPLPIPSIPWGKDQWYSGEYGMFSHENKPSDITTPDYRSISDPTVMYFENKWYLYPSYGMAWVSEDFCTWKHVRTEPYCPKYSPSVTPWKGKFLLTSWNCPLYVGETPTGPFTELGPLTLPDGKTFLPCDPGIFTDEDGRIYIYYFAAKGLPGKTYFRSQILGVEVDPDEPTKVVRGPVPVAEINPLNRPWERAGNANQNPVFGWLEGPHLIRHDGRYYLICAAPNTQFESYCMEVFYSDSDPLGRFVCQKRNPLTLHRTGIVRGCGHGCVEHGPGHTLWAFYTISVPYLHIFERRIGMDRVEIDENGEMYCPYGVTDTPRRAPGAPDAGADIGYLPLNGWLRPTASSQKPGRDPMYSCDGSALTYWQPAEDDAEPWLCYDLAARYTAGAVRLFWREDGLDYASGARPGPMRYLMEGKKNAEDEWRVLLDRSQSEDDFNVDYQVFEEQTVQFVRLRLIGAPAGIHPGVIDCTLFGYLPMSEY